MPGDILNYGVLKEQVQGRRFTNTQLTSGIPYWLFQAYQDVWDAGDWHFKKVRLAALALTSGSYAGTVDDARGPVVDVLNVYDENGSQIPRLPWDDWRARYAQSISDATVTSKPTAWALDGTNVRVGPRADATYAWTCDYRRGVTTRTSLGVEQPGWFQGDADIPLWDGHGRLLVVRAQSIGLKDVNDPTFGPLDDEYDIALARFTEDHHDRGAAPVQFGRQAY